MRILMMTNSYRPTVGGLERSIEYFTQEFRRLGHQVLIVAPAQKGAPEHERGVCRIPAIKNFNKTDFSIELPIYFNLSRALVKFRPQVVHAHHPFLVGNTALRVASKFKAPVIFTHHTLYEENTHYVPFNSGLIKQFVVVMATTYANLADCVFAPSRSIADLIRQRGVKRPVEVVPTGIYPDRFRVDNAREFRLHHGIRQDTFVVGTAGRLAPEKNIDFLMRGVLAFLQEHENAVFLVVGDGVSQMGLKKFFRQHGCSKKLICTGTLQAQELADAYHAMDVFAFASHSETQGLVLLESMACGVPVVAVDASGVRDVVRDRVNGFMIPDDDERDFAKAIREVACASDKERAGLREAAVAVAAGFTMDSSAAKALAVYERLVDQRSSGYERENNHWQELLRRALPEMEFARALVKTAATAEDLENEPGSRHQQAEV